MREWAAPALRWEAPAPALPDAGRVRRHAPPERPAAEPHRRCRAGRSRAIAAATSSSSPPPTRRSPAWPRRGGRSASRFPRVRLANWMALAHPYSVDLYAEKVLAHAKLVVCGCSAARPIGATGSTRRCGIARGNGAKLVVVPGDATWDAALAAHGTVAEGDARRLWSYLVEGGSENLANALRYLRASDRRRARSRKKREPLPSAGIYRLGSRSSETFSHEVRRRSDGASRHSRADRRRSSSIAR